MATEPEDRAVVSSMCHWFQHPADPDSTYVVSHTGLIIQVTTRKGSDPSEINKHVVAMVNGSMAQVGLGQVVDCVNFDWYIMDWFALPYQTHKVVGIAYFDPASCTYQELDPNADDQPPYPNQPEAQAPLN